MRVIAEEKYVQIYISKMAEAIQEILKSTENHAFVGIYTNGATLCQRIMQKLKGNFDYGSLDINFYRDDFTMRAPNPVIQETNITFDVTGKTIFLIDDVIYTGRTIAAALRALFDFGRPERVILVTLIDRGGRELPIQPDINGLKSEVGQNEEVVVKLKPHDEIDKIYLRKVKRS